VLTVGDGGAVHPEKDVLPAQTGSQFARTLVGGVGVLALHREVGVGAEFDVQLLQLLDQLLGDPGTPHWWPGGSGR
jgi:hypothetical protein